MVLTLSGPVYEKGEITATGKTKVIHKVLGYPDLAIMGSKSDTTAGNGARHDVIEGKAEASTTITSNIFQILEASGIETHFLEKISDTEILVEECDMIPLECVWRFVSTGSHHKREKNLYGNSASLDGTVLDEPTMEFFYKNDVYLKNEDKISDPLMDCDEDGNPRIENGKFVLLHPDTGEKLDYTRVVNPSTKIELSQGDIKREQELILRYAAEIREQTLGIGKTLQGSYGREDIVLMDGKAEFGISKKDGKMKLADVLDGDSKRISIPIVIEDMQGQKYLGKGIKPGYFINTYFEDKYKKPVEEYAVFLYSCDQYIRLLQERNRPDLIDAFEGETIKIVFEEYKKKSKDFPKEMKGPHTIEELKELFSSDRELFESAIQATKTNLYDSVTRLLLEIEEKYDYRLERIEEDGEMSFSKGWKDILRERVLKYQEENIKPFNEGVNIIRYIEGEGLDKQGFRDGGIASETGDKYQKLAVITTRMFEAVNVLVEDIRLRFKSLTP